MSAMQSQQPVTTQQPRAVKSYKNKAGVAFETGDVIYLKKGVLTLFKKSEQPVFAGKNIMIATVDYLFPDVKGLVRLNVKLGGYWTWDVNDLEKVEKVK